MMKKITSWFRRRSGKISWHCQRCFQILVESVPTFARSEGQLRASALTYYTLFSIVPVFALLFGIAKGFGLDEWLKEEMLQKLSSHEDILNWLYNFADTTLREARGGLVAGIGALLLFWTVIKMIGNIERAFNRVWKIEKGRNLFRKFTDYLSFLVIAPLLLAAAGSATVLAAGYLRKIAAANAALAQVSRPLIEFGVQSVPYLLAWALFSFIYSFLPNTRVKFSAAVFGGIIAGTLFQLLQEGYIYIQMGLSRYNVIYGSFSALPLFLIWMFLNWMVVLYGVTLAWLFQNFDYESRKAHDELLTGAEKRLLAVLLAAETAHDFAAGRPPVTEEALAQRCRLSATLTRELLEKLVERRILTPVTSEEYGDISYQPALPLARLTVAEVLERLDDFYVRHPERQMTSPLLKELESALRTLRDHMEKGGGNRMLTDFFSHCEKSHDSSSATAGGAF